jgi:hypothetical protein
MNKAEEYRDRARFVMSIFFDYIDEYVNCSSMPALHQSDDRDLNNIKALQNRFRFTPTERLFQLIEGHRNELSHNDDGYFGRQIEKEKYKSLVADLVQCLKNLMLVEAAEDIRVLGIEVFGVSLR